MVREAKAEGMIAEDEVFEYVDAEIHRRETDITLDSYEELMNKVSMRTGSRLGILTGMIEDPRVQEVMINGTKEIFIEKNGSIERYAGEFSSVEELEEIIRAIAASVHREINEMNPILDARLPDGSRVNAVFRNVALDGPVLTIRKNRSDHMTIRDMIHVGTLTGQCAGDLMALVRSGYNIFISGGTSSGKTTFLNALSDMIPEEERVIIIEDSRELVPGNIDNIVQMECHNANSTGNGRITMEQLIRTSLRMRPDRLIVGEVRGGEVSDMLQAMNTGHDGCLSTGHGNSALGMLRRIEAMYLSGVDIPIEAIRSQIVEGIDIIVHLERLKGGRRKVMEIQEILGTKEGEYILNPLYVMGDDGVAVRTGNQLINRAKLEHRGREMDHGL